MIFFFFRKLTFLEKGRLKLLKTLGVEHVFGLSRLEDQQALLSFFHPISPEMSNAFFLISTVAF